MKKYKVIALSVGGKGNKIYHSGNVVKADNFLEGHADELVKQGFLVEQTDEESAVNNVSDDNSSDNTTGGASSSEAKSKSFVNEKGATVIVKTIEDINKRQIIAELKKANVDFDSNLSKEILFPLWFNN